MEEDKKPKRGGSRPNAGRKPKAEQSRMITFRASQDVYEILMMQPNKTEYIEKAIREKRKRELRY